MIKRYMVQEECELGWANVSEAMSLYEVAHFETDFSDEEFEQIAALEVSESIAFEGGACPAFRVLRTE